MKHRSALSALAFATALTAASAAAQDTARVASATADTADSRPTVAVMDFTNSALGAQNRDYEPLRKGIADLLINEMAANPRIRLVERDRLQEILREQQLSREGNVDQATAVRVGKLLGVHNMIFGAFVIDPQGKTRLVARAVDVNTGRVIQPTSVNGTRDNIIELISNLATRLNENLRLPEMPRGVREASTNRARRGNLQSALLYSRAIEARDRGDNAQAIQLLSATIAQFPDMTPARNMLAQLQTRQPGT